MGPPVGAADGLDNQPAGVRARTAPCVADWKGSPAVRDLDCLRSSGLPTAEPFAQCHEPMRPCIRSAGHAHMVS